MTLPDGRKGLIKGYYGSCSGCDAFEAEFSFDFHDYQDHPDGTSQYEFKEDCEKCQSHKAKLKAFGEGYFDSLQTPEELAKEYVENSYWSSYDETPSQAEFVYKRLDPSSPVAVALRDKIDNPCDD